MHSGLPPFPARPPELTHPSLSGIGEVGAYFLTGRPDWIRRHVETVALRTENAARRRLTIDVVLPPAPEASHPWRDGARLFYLPLTTLAKRPARTNLDLCDESGQSLPVLNRRENATITSVALRRAVERLVGGQVSPELNRSLRELARTPSADAEIAMAYAITILQHEWPAVIDSRAYEAFQELLIHLSANWVLWTGAVGVPRERRVFKLGYDIALPQPRIPRQRPHSELITVITRTGESEYEREDPGDRNERGNLRRFANRVTNPLGLTSFDVIVERPYIRAAASYHLQVRAPDGVEARRVRLFARLRDPDGREIAPVAVAKGDTAHMYFSGLRVDTPGDASISFRVEARGLLSYSVVTTALITAMLLLYARYADELEAQPEVPGAALLIVPALLVSFGLRPGEHPVVARLLSGVRIVVLASGTLAVAAALALVGVRAGNADTDDTLRHLGEISAALTSLLVVSWVLALERVEDLRRLARRAWASYRYYRVTAAILPVASVALMYVSPKDSGLPGFGEIATLAALGALSAFSAWTALFADETSNPARSRHLAYVLAANALALAWAAIEFSGLLRRPFDWPDVRTGLIIFMWSLLVVVLIEIFWRSDPNQLVASDVVPTQDQIEDQGMEVPNDDDDAE